MQTLDNDLDAVNATLGINQPTTEGATFVATARVGQVFDVIRRRRNQLLESYVSVDFSS